MFNNKLRNKYNVNGGIMFFISRLKRKIRQVFIHFDTTQTEMQILNLRHFIVPNPNAQIQQNHFLIMRF